MNIPTIMISTKEQQMLVEKLGVVHNILGFDLIKVAQMSPRFKGCFGPLDVRYNKRRKYNPDEHDSMYAWEFVQTKAEPMDDPYPSGPPIGTGKVMYMVDDKEPTPSTSKSGAKEGYNREFLATHWGEGFKVLDPEQEIEIRARAEAIQARIEAEKQGTYQPEPEVDPIADEENPITQQKPQSMRDKITQKLTGNTNIGA